MKTSVMDVKDMLSVLSVEGVEKRIGEVPGVESVTVNHAAGNATVRYDETRLEIADIRLDVRQSQYELDSAATGSKASGREGDKEHKGHQGHAVSGDSPPTPASKTPSTPLAVVPAAPDAVSAATSSMPSAPTAVPDANAATAPADSANDELTSKLMPGKP